MNRGERRHRTERIARRRLKSLAEAGKGQKVGWFRKWNLTCQCKWCQITKVGDIELQRMKDERRNPISLTSAIHL